MSTTAILDDLDKEVLRTLFDAYRDGLQGRDTDYSSGLDEALQQIESPKVRKLVAWWAQALDKANRDGLNKFNESEVTV